MRLGVGLVLAVCTAMTTSPPVVRAQVVNIAPPEAIYWRQNLFSIPYQWSSSSPGTAHTVWLYVSKDRGTSWQKITSAQPQILAFNYRAEADGEYWFAIRTTDASGRDARESSTRDFAAAMQPELRVIVDTAMPRFESLTNVLRNDAALDVRWRVVDANLQAHSCQIEVQYVGSDTWQPVPLSSASETSPGAWNGQATVKVEPPALPAAVRATVIDLAGNRAMYQSTATATGAAAGSLAFAGPSIPSGRNDSPATTYGAEPGWVSGSAPPLTANQQNAPARPQLWPADRSGHAETAASDEHRAPITYGTPIGAGNVSTSPPTSAGETLDLPEPETEDRPLGNIPPQRGPTIEPLEPFRQASLSRQAAALLPAERIAETTPTSPRATLVNSRSFALEYEFAEVGTQGLVKVELWGTRDGGATWQSFAVDDDNRSPLHVTVDGEGEYGFRIVVEGAGGVGGFPPQSGDKPELWVGVDLEPPQAQLLAVSPDRSGAGNQLVLRWEAEDDNLEPRPIALFFSSRAPGPWTAIATSLENVGEYTWTLERHVPRRVYLRLEARDTAGNVAAYQTSEPVVVESEPAVASWKRLPPVE